MNDKKHSVWFHIFDVLINIVVIIAIVAAIRTFLVSPFQVEGISMDSTLEHKEYIIINKLGYHIGSPERGDIVVFRPPTDLDRPYVKRVIGLPGDRVVVEDGKVFVQAADSGELTELNENYLNAENAGRTYKAPTLSGNTEPAEFFVPEGEYFVLGDNRQHSLDSRGFTGENGEPLPFVPEDNILGKVWVVALPISKIQAIEPPDYDL